MKTTSYNLKMPSAMKEALQNHAGNVSAFIREAISEKLEREGGVEIDSDLQHGGARPGAGRPVEQE